MKQSVHIWEVRHENHYLGTEDAEGPSYQI